MPQFIRYIGKDPIIIKNLSIKPGQLIRSDTLSDDAEKIISKNSKEFREIPENDFSCYNDILNSLKDPRLAYSYAEIRCALVREVNEKRILTPFKNNWDAYLIKIVPKRKDENISKINTSPTILLQKPNFLIFRENVNLKSLKLLLKNIMYTERFDLGNFTIRCYDGRFHEDYFCMSSWGERYGLNWPSKVYSYKVSKTFNIPSNLNLKKEGFKDHEHAIRELMEIGFEHHSFSDTSIILILPYYLAKISRCEIQEKSLTIKIEKYNEETTLKNIKCWYYYKESPSSSGMLGEREAKEGRGEISSLKLHNEVELPLVPGWVDVWLLHRELDEQIDEFRISIEKKTSPVIFDINVKLPEMFDELKGVLEKAGFEDATGKIVLAAATNLLEVVITKKLQDLGSSIQGSLNEKIERVIKEINEKEHRKIDHQLISPLLKVARDKLDHEGFRLIVTNQDASFLLKRTIDFMKQLYT